ncbi:hypothetical protein [Bradyrhizobium sp. 164]|uniref:hypothetical protein n=1 Tax=Bradyrhizobium sp. 164 TaxID=2782637 RepID=UPI001FFA758C|nr:hypothetical protein [Bradyrhizobium sp. 164]MCK1598838.1 hypothetical protein [Bradyrhizobium sp. 164]
MTKDESAEVMCACIAVHVSRCIPIYDTIAAQKDINLLLGFDFHEYVSITEGIPGKGRTFPNFRPDRSTIRPGEGFWVVGLDRNNDVMLTNATRMYDLSHSNFAEHLRSLNAFYSNPIVHAHFDDHCTCIASTAEEMTGRIAYNGDLWARRDFRGQGVPRMIARVTHRLSHAMWAPDFLCALVARWRVDKGLPHYPHHEPGGWILRLVEEDIAEENWLVWVTGDELKKEVDHCCKNLFALPSSTAWSDTAGCLNP